MENGYDPLDSLATDEKYINNKTITEGAIEGGDSSDFPLSVMNSLHSTILPERATVLQNSDGSAYHPSEPKKAQILQKIQRIPVEVTSCQVKLRILVGWCGGEYVAMNYMHSFIETHRTPSRMTKAQCHQSSPNDTTEIEQSIE